MTGLSGKGGAPDPPSGPAGDGDASKLSAFGERFMQMFDDYDEVQAARRRQHTASTSQRKSRKPAAAQQPSTGTAQQQQQQQQQHAAGGQQQRQHGTAAAQLKHAAHTAAKRSRAEASDEIDEILQAHAKRPKQGGRRTLPTQPGVQVVDQAHIMGGGPAARLSIDMKAARRTFMSHKATKVHSCPVGQDELLDRAGPEIDPSLSAEEFKQMALQIERLGGAALDDKKQRKQWKAQFLERLGAKPERLPRMAAKMGVGVAKKRVQREARALAEAIASGAVRVKGMGKKKAAEKDAKRDMGLQEAGAGFKNGILRVRDPEKPQQQQGPKRKKGGKAQQGPKRTKGGKR